MKKPIIIFAITAAAIFLSCHKKEGNTRFTALPSSHSNITFKNSIQEDEDYNIITYEYLYNGGGVATGDVNNDGQTDIAVDKINSRITLFDFCNSPVTENY